MTTTGFSLATVMVDPVLPVWLIAALVAAVLGIHGLICLGYDLPVRTRLGLWLLRAASLLLLVWLLLLPELRNVTVEKELPVLGVAVDASASMTEKLGDNRSNRGDNAVDFLTSRTTRAWFDKFRVMRYEIGDDLQESRGDVRDLAFAGARSFIAPGLNQVAARLQGQNVSGVIVLSDGLDQSGENLSPLARSLPLYVLELEPPSVQTQTLKPDLYIAEVAAPKRTVVQWQTKIEALVRRRGTAAVSVPVKLLEGERELRTTTLTFAENEGYQHAVFEITPNATGQTLYRVELDPPAGSDSIKENNFREFVMDVTDPENRILYIEGSPRWEFKFLKRALIADKNFLLAVFVSTGFGVFLSFNENSGMGKGDAPKFTRDGLAPYKIVILGDMTADSLREDDYKGLLEFVDKGGGLLITGGAKALATNGWASVVQMKDMMPARPAPGSKMHEGEFPATLTAAGRTHPAVQGLATEKGFPPLLSYWEPMQTNEFSSVLLSTTGDAPVLIVRRFGQGKVAMLCSDSLWRWQLGSSDTGTGVGAGKNLYNQFMTQLAYWLTPELKQTSDSNAILQVFTADSEVDVRKQITIGAALESGGKALETTLACRVETPDSQKLSFPMAPGLLGANVGLPKPLKGYLADFAPPVPGRYRITVSSADGQHTAETILLVRQAYREKTGAPANAEYLRGLAQASGGLYVAWKDREKFFEKIPREVRERRMTTQQPLWPHWYWLTLLIAIFAAEWLWRRRLDLE